MAFVCHVATTFNLRSGMARRTRAVLHALREEGHRVALVCGRDHDVRASDLTDIELHVVPGLLKRLAPLEDAAALGSLTRLVRRLQPDVVHTHLAKAGILGRLAAHRARVRLVAHTVHGPTFPDHLGWATRSLYRGLERRAAAVTDALVFVGDELRRSYAAAGVRARREEVVIRTGRAGLALADPGPEARGSLRRELAGGPATDLLLVSVGRPVPAKRQEDGIVALAALRERGIDARLAIVGECLVEDERGHLGWLRDEARRRGVADRVHFTGFRADVLSIMNAADAVLLTSRHEGLPNVAVEAAASGTPLVAYAVCGVGEVVVPGETGFILAPGDRPALVEALAELARDPARLRAATREHGRRLAREYSMERMLALKLELYRRLLGGG